MREETIRGIKLNTLLKLKTESEIFDKLQVLSLTELQAWAYQNDFPLRKNLSRVKALNDLSRQIHTTGTYQRIASTNKW